MTAEVAILNKSAVALAADSAASIQTRGGHKIYNTVNKLFGLSKYQPVGIMIYGTADLIGIPWETIIKSFRHQLGSKSFDRLEDYAEALKTFLAKNTVLFSPEAQHAGVRSRLLDLFAGVMERAGKHARARRQTEEEALTAAYRGFNMRTASCANLTGYSDQDLDLVLERNKAPYDEAMQAAFEDVKLGSDLTELIRKAASLHLCKAHDLAEYSGIVIAGFGDLDVFPALVSFDVHYVCDDQPRMHEHAAYRIKIDDSSCVIPFAQDQLVTTFMEGVDPGYQEYIDTAITKLLRDDYPQLLAAAIADIPGIDTESIRKKLSEVGLGVVEGFTERAKEYRFGRHVAAITSAVSFLPKDDLASLAESLVSLTSLKKRVTLDPETVGGPIDVVVISKGDGFVWMKRKHYFKPELNPHFFTNYFREGKTDAQDGP